MNNEKILGKISELMNAIKTVLKYRKIYKYFILVNYKINDERKNSNITIYSFNKYKSDDFNNIVRKSIGSIFPGSEEEYIELFIKANPDFFIINFETGTTVYFDKNIYID